MFWRSLPNDDVKFSYLRFWRQRELTSVNLNTKTIRAKQAKVHSAYLTWNNHKRFNFTQSSILMWPFRCCFCRSFLNSLVFYSARYDISMSRESVRRPKFNIISFRVVEQGMSRLCKTLVYCRCMQSWFFFGPHYWQVLFSCSSSFRLVTHCLKCFDSDYCLF